MSDPGYTYIWEYDVRPDGIAAFLGHYAPGGTWARLFRRAEGYDGTELYRDAARPERFVTVDHWRSEAAFRAFRQEFAAEFEALDRRCGELTVREVLVGEFRSLARGG
jgi:heme-degrading monooxygenase HmoA